MYSIGVDIADIKRIKRLIRNSRFCRRVFSGEEIAYCRTRKIPEQHFAVRFAAKEAVWKTLGKPGISHRDICIRNSPDGKPSVRLPAQLKKLEKKFTVSLSHTREYAVAVALFQGKLK